MSPSIIRIYKEADHEDRDLIRKSFMALVFVGMTMIFTNYVLVDEWFTGMVGGYFPLTGLLFAYSVARAAEDTRCPEIKEHCTRIHELREQMREEKEDP